MRNQKRDSNGKPRRNQEEREKGMGPRNWFPEEDAAGSSEQEDEEEMDNLYREEENCGTVEAV